MSSLPLQECLAVGAHIFVHHHSSEDGLIQHLVVEARDAAQYSPVQKNDLAPNVKSAEVQDPGAKQTHLLGSTAKQQISDSVVMTSVSRTGD